MQDVIREIDNSNLSNNIFPPIMSIIGSSAGKNYTTFGANL